MIGIIDIGLSNVGSVKNMLKKTGCVAEIIKTPDRVEKAEKLILPGVGKFDHAVRQLDDLGLRMPIVDRVNAGVPMLGICLGMQLMMDRSDEGVGEGLGLINGSVVKFPATNSSIKVPHMGWNTLEWRKSCALSKGFGTEPSERFYFVHSFYVKPRHSEDVMSTTMHGIEFASGIQRDLIFGVQFHPEKSHRYGLRVLQNFIQVK